MSFLTSDPGVVIFHYLVVAVALLGIGAAYRLRSPRALLVMTAGLGVGTCIFTLAPLGRPYDLIADNPRSPDPLKDSNALVELAEVTSAAASRHPVSGFVSGLRNPRPLWSLAFRVVTAGSPERAVRLLALASIALPGALALAIFAVFRSVGSGSAWKWAAASFVALLASSPPLDAFRPFGSFFESFFLESPHRGACLVLGAIVWGTTWKARRPVTLALATGSLIAVAWIDFWIFVWLALGLLAFQILEGPHREAKSAPVWIVLLLAVIGAGGRLAVVPIGSSVSRIPFSSEVLSYRALFLDPLTVSADLQWVFLLAASTAVWVWRDEGAMARGLVSVALASYTLFAGAAIAYQVNPFAEPSLFFHLVRFSVGLLAGTGGVVLIARLSERVPWTRSISTSARDAAAAGVVVALFLPASFPFYWTPSKMNPLYYRCLKPVEPETAALAAWMEANTDGDAVVLATTATSEYLAALGGRTVVYAARLLPREEAARRRRSIRALLRAESDTDLRAALEDLGVTVIAWEPEFRWEYGEAPLARWEASSAFTVFRPSGTDFVVFRWTEGS